MNTESTVHVPAIDVHGHYGDYTKGEPDRHVGRFLTADAAMVAARAQQSGIHTTVVSPLSGLLPRGQADAVSANVEAAEAAASTDGLMQWVIVHPNQPETFDQAAEMLKQPQCLGIKIHPEEHVYPIRDFGDKLFEFAARHKTVVLAHTGDENSLPDDFVPFANEYSDMQLILAHLGNGGAASGNPTLQVRAIQVCQSDNVYVDTSSARSLMPGLVEWAVAEIGAERVLFGTDTPLYFTAMQRSRIDHAEISETDKHRILYQNAERLFDRCLTKTTKEQHVNA